MKAKDLKVGDKIRIDPTAGYWRDEFAANAAKIQDRVLEIYAIGGERPFFRVPDDCRLSEWDDTLYVDDFEYPFIFVASADTKPEVTDLATKSEATDLDIAVQALLRLQYAIERQAPSGKREDALLALSLAQSALLVMATDLGVENP